MSMYEATEEPLTEIGLRGMIMEKSRYASKARTHAPTMAGQSVMRSQQDIKRAPNPGEVSP